MWHKYEGQLIVMRVQRGPSEHDTYAGTEAPRSLSAATVLESTNVQQQDPLGRAGWGTALWTEGQMKARKDFMLPVPPIGLHVINSSVAEWQNLLNISHGFGHRTNKLLPPSTKVFHRRSELSFAIAQIACSAPP